MLSVTLKLKVIIILRPVYIDIYINNEISLFVKLLMHFLSSSNMPMRPHVLGGYGGRPFAGGNLPCNKTAKEVLAKPQTGGM